MKRSKTISKPFLKLITLLMLAQMATSLCAMPIYADTKTTPSCKSVISACDKALADKDAAIKARDAQLGDYAKLTRDQADQISRDKAWFKSPYLWLAVGLFGGLYLGHK